MNAVEFKVPCEVCKHSTRKGQLWLGGTDWLLCPACEGTGEIVGREYRYTPKEKFVFVPGSRMRIERKMFLSKQQEEYDQSELVHVKTI